MTAMPRLMHSGSSSLSATWSSLVHAGAHSSDGAVGAQAIERSICVSQGVVVVVVGVVDVEDVDAVEAQPSQALMERPHDPVVAEIEHRVDRRRAAPGLAGLGQRVRAEESANLARKREFVARLLRENLAHSRLGEPVPVQGRGVEEADAGVPSALDDSHPGGFVNRLEQSTQRGGAKPESGDRQGGAAEGDSLGWIQFWLPPD